MQCSTQEQHVLSSDGNTCSVQNRTCMNDSGRGGGGRGYAGIDRRPVSVEWTAGETVCVVAPDVQTKVRVKSRATLYSVTSCQ
jgi:hypothetical protein